MGGFTAALLSFSEFYTWASSLAVSSLSQINLATAVARFKSNQSQQETQHPASSEKQA